MRHKAAAVRLMTLALLFLLPLLIGCDPAGLLRIQLQLRSPEEQFDEIKLDSADVREALQILDTVVARHGYETVAPETGYVRFYILHLPPVTVRGQNYWPKIPCRSKLAPAGLFVTFGRYTLVAGTLREQELFKDVRKAFITRYGIGKVSSHWLGGAKYDGGPIPPDRE